MRRRARALCTLLQRSHAATAATALLCRGDYGVDVGRNIIHGSDSLEASSQWPCRSVCRLPLPVLAARPLLSCTAAMATLLAACLAVPQSAQREIALWFSPDELARYDLNSKAWTYE